MKIPTSYLIRNLMVPLTAATLLLLPVAVCYAQEPLPPQAGLPSAEEELELNAERIETEEEQDYYHLFLELDNLLDAPVNVNSAGYDELKVFFFLNDLQINNLIDYISKYGAIKSVAELHYIEGFDREVIGWLTPFIVFGSIEQQTLPLSEKIRRGRSQFFLRYHQTLEPQKGYMPASDSLLQANPNSRYKGSPNRLFARYGFNYRDELRFGITAEKDPGEEFFKGAQPYGFSFYSAFFAYRGKGLVRDVVIGDYQLEFGQGLVIWTTPSFGKGSDPVAVRKIPRGIRPSASANEIQFLRGAAVTLGYRQLQFSLFISQRNIDATVKQIDTLTGKASVVSAIRTSGFHRTNSELEHRRSLGEFLYGMRGTLRAKNFQVGITGYRLDYGSQIQPADRVYNRFYFRGNQHAVAGADFFYLFQNLQLFGEAALTHKGATALQLGALAHPSPRIALSVVYRDLSKEFPYMWNAPFSESASPSGEVGIYTGMTFLVTRNITFSGYADYFRFRWLRFQADAPGFGVEYRCELEWQLSRNAEIRLRYRYKQRDANVDDNQYLHSVLPGVRQSFRLHLQYQATATASLILRNRAEILQFSGQNTTATMGFLIYQDLIWRPGSRKWNFAFRYAIFDTDTHNERIYAYENDVLYAFSVPAYYNRGSRSYLLLQRQMTNNLDFWFKIGQTWWADTNLVGSGLDEIEGSTRSEVRAQIRYKF